MQGLKVFVIAMGVLIVLGTTVLIVVIAGRIAHGPAARAFTAAPIDLPPGARIEALSTGTDRVVLALVLPDGGRELVVVDLATGARLGTVPLHSAP